MTETKRDELMRPISVSISPTLIDQLHARALEQTPENPNVSAYVRRLIMQDLSGTVLDRSRALWIYKELERVEGFLGTLPFVEAVPKPLSQQAGDLARAVATVRDSLWRLAADSKPPAGASSASTAGGSDASAAVADADFGQLAQSVPSRAIAAPSGRTRRPSSGNVPPSKVPRSAPKRARG